ncbi:MAG: HesA/MoeB/ThiF family protein [Candidatus Bathyarchaeota archaeon]|nr:HesA/MoeB/ThiF family protein [Candidatus Bathyarchaeota archaeon]
MNLPDEAAFAKDFYSRQVTLKELGQVGQDRLCKSKVAVVGVGGLGTVSSMYLALAGVGYLRLIDQDVVETKNLHRQILYSPDDVNYPKAEMAAQRLQKLNPLVNAQAVCENIHAENVERLLSGVDLVVDGLDNMATRYLVNRACVKLEIPYVFGAAIGLEGNLSVFAPPQAPCLECVLPNISDNDMLKCSSRGVLGATPGIIGAMQALEAIKVLSGTGTPLKGKLMICDFTDMSFTTIDVFKRDNCPACTKTPPSTKTQQRIAWLCGKNTANINPQTALTLNLDLICDALERLGFPVKLRSRLALLFNYKGLDVSLFNNGRMLIKNVPDEQVALTAYQEIAKTLGLTGAQT